MDSTYWCDLTAEINLNLRLDIKNLKGRSLHRQWYKLTIQCLRGQLFSEDIHQWIQMSWETGLISVSEKIIEQFHKLDANSHIQFLNLSKQSNSYNRTFMLRNRAISKKNDTVLYWNQPIWQTAYQRMGSLMPKVSVSACEPQISTAIRKSFNGLVPSVKEYIP